MLVQYCTVIIILAKQVISLFTYKTPSYPPLDCNLFTNIIKYIAHRKHTETSHFLAQHRSCSFPQIFFIKVTYCFCTGGCSIIILGQQVAVVHHPVGPESDEEAAAAEDEEEGVRGDSTQHGVQFWRCHEQPSSKYGHF